MAKQLRLCVTGKILSPNEDEKSNLKKLQASYRGVGEHPCFPVTLTFGERPRVARMNKFLEQLEKLFEMMIFQPPVQPAEVAESAVPDTAERAEARPAAGNTKTAVNAAGAVADDALVPYVEALYALDERKQIIDDAVDLLIDLVCRDGVPPTPNAPASLHPMQLAWISYAISYWGRQGKHRFPATWTALPQVAELLAYLRHLAPAEQCSADPQAAETGFELTQLIGWISLNCLTAYKFAVPVRGTIHDTFADYQAGARFDIFGPDGSQLASCRVDPEHLRLAVLDALLPATASACLPSPTCDTAPESQGLCVTIDDASDLRYVLRQRADSEAAAQRATVVRGRIWRTDGLPLGVRGFAIFAPPAFAQTVDPCCGALDLGADAGRCDDPMTPQLIKVPHALAIAETDENGYFTFNYTQSDDHFQNDFVVLHLAGAQTAMVVQLVWKEHANRPGKQRAFPEPLLIPYDGSLLTPIAVQPGEFDTDDLEDSGNCKGLQLDQATRILEEHSHQLFLRTSDPAITLLRWPHADQPDPSVQQAQHPDGTHPDQPDLGVQQAQHPDAYFRTRLDRTHPVAWDQSGTMAQAETIAHGRILTFKQIWRSDGYSLGDLLYSLPLAPLQQKNIAVIDWARAETTSLDSAQEYRESFRNEQSRDRDISEIIHSTLTENSHGESQSGARASSGSSGLLGAVFGGSSGGGSSAWSSASQYSSRSLVSNFLNQLRDRTNQAANSYKSLRMTTVQQVNQSETAKAVTETVANRNACHAITIQYFEVLRHFRVDCELSAVSECLFVPLPVDTFTAEKALRWRTGLASSMPTQQLQDSFAALSRLHEKPAFPYPQGTYAQQLMQKAQGELELAGIFPMPEALKAAPAYVRVPGYEVIEDFPQALAEVMHETDAAKRVILFDKTFPPLLLRRYAQRLIVHLVNSKGANVRSVSSVPGSAYVNGELASLRLAIDFLFDTNEPAREDITDVHIHLNGNVPTTWQLFLTEIDLSYSSTLLDHALLQSRFTPQELAWRSLFGHYTDQYISVKTPVTRVEKRNPRDEDLASERRLLAHLNQNIAYFHKVIWWTMDPDRRYGLLDGYIAPNSGGRSVASVVENRVAGIVGNSLIMPLAPGMRLDGFTENTPFTGNAGEKGTGASASNGQQADTNGATEMDSEADLFAAYLPSTPNPSTRISVPTRGVFAESVIGGCNGCEQIDDTRNWRYWEHPLPEQPTAIGQIDLGSRRAEKPFAVPQMPASPIQQGEPLPAPAPATLQQIVDILGAANAFRDLAGLSGTQQNAREALNASFETTQKAYEIATNAMIEGAKAAASAYAQAPIGDVSKLKSAVSKDVKAGRVTPEQGRATIAKINDAVADGLGGKTPSGLFDNPDVTSAISAAAVRGASLSMEQGNAKVDVGMAPEESPATPKRRAPWPLSLLSARQAQSAPLPPTANLSFTLLAEAYPTQPRAALFKQLGGEWPMLTSRLEYNNTCAIRMSVAMKGAGVTLPRSYREAIEGDGSTLIIKVETLSRFLNELLGKPGWNRAKRPGEKITLPATKGIVMYRGDWGLATGHVDLWTGTGFVGEGNPGDMLNSHYVALWPLA